MKKSSFKSAFSETSLSRPTPSEKLPKSIRSRTPAPLESTSKASRFREFVNLKRARIDASQRPKSKKILTPLRNKQQSGNAKATKEPDKRSATKSARTEGLKSKNYEQKSISPFPTRNFTCTEKVEDKPTKPVWVPDMIFNVKENSTTTAELYHIGSATSPQFGETDENELNISNSEIIEVRISLYSRVKCEIRIGNWVIQFF